MIPITELITILNEYPKDAEITCCTCGEELLVFVDNRQIGKIRVSGRPEYRDRIEC